MKGTLARAVCALSLSLELHCLCVSGLLAQTEWRAGGLSAPPGQLTSGFLSLPPGGDGETQIPVTIVNGKGPGPALALVAAAGLPAFCEVDG